METRNTKLIVGTAGGTAGKGSKTYKISIPSKWVNELDLEHKDAYCPIFDNYTRDGTISARLTSFSLHAILAVNEA